MTLIDSNQDIKISRESILALRDSEDIKDLRESDLQDYEEERESMAIPDSSLDKFSSDVKTDPSEALTFSEDNSQCINDFSNNIQEKSEETLVQQNLKIQEDSTHETSQKEENNLSKDEKQFTNINLDDDNLKGIQIEHFSQDNDESWKEILPPSLPPPLPPSVPLSNFEDIKVDSATNSNFDNSDIKIFVQSDIFIGPGIKKLLKFKPSQLFDTELPFIPNFLRLIKESINILIPEVAMLLMYYEPDIDDFVLLDDASRPDFLNQSKKILRIDQNSKFDLSKYESTNDDMDMLKPPPPIPSTPPPLPPPRPISLLSVERSISKREKAKISIFDSTPNPSILLSKVEFEQRDLLPMLLHQIYHKCLNSNIYCTIITSQIPCPSLAWRFTNTLPYVGSQIVSINGIYLQNLDLDLQLALIQSRERPMSIEFQVDNPLSMDIIEESKLRPQSINVTALKTQSLKSNLVHSKYVSSFAGKLRKKVDKIIEDYITCDWSKAYASNSGNPQTTLRSLYPYVEQELQKLDLFDPRKSKGQGFPLELTESQSDQVKEQIEELIFLKVAEFTISLFPIYHPKIELRPIGDYYSLEIDPSDHHKILTKDIPKRRILLLPNLEFSYENNPSQYISQLTNEDLTQSVIDFSPDIPLQLKLSFLRFITLSQLGASPSHALALPTNVTDAFLSNFHLLQQDSWYLILKAFHRALSYSTPMAIMHKLVAILHLITQTMTQTLQPTKQAIERIHCLCGQLHLLDHTNHAMNFSEQEDFSMILEEYSSHPYLQHVSNHLQDKDNFHITADDLLPALIWVMIQSNPSLLAERLWICEEFHHPELFHGEMAYALTQFTSALSFFQEISFSSLDLPSLKQYNASILQYKNTLQLILACKLGNRSMVEDLLRLDSTVIDINGYTPDMRDTPLSTCIRYQQLDLLSLLLQDKRVNINQKIHLYHGPNERCSTLFLTLLQDNFKMTMLLLKHGADRYLADYHGMTPLSYIQARHSYTLELIFQADPIKESYIPLILLSASQNVSYPLVNYNSSVQITSNILPSTPISTSSMNTISTEELIVGLLLQEMPCNYLDLHYDKILSPLHTIVITKQLSLLFLFTAYSHTTTNLQFAIEWDIVNSCEESPLMLACYLYLVSEDVEYLQMALIFLRHGCDRTFALRYIEKINPQDLTRLPPLSSIEYFNQRYKVRNEDEEDQDIETKESIDGADSIDQEILKIGNKQKSASFPPFLKNTDPYQLIRAILLNDPLSTTQQPIYELAKNRDSLSVKALLLQGVDVNPQCPKKRFNTLTAAVYNQDIQMIELLYHSESMDQWTHSCSSSWYSYFDQYFHSPNISNLQSPSKSFFITSSPVPNKSASTPSTPIPEFSSMPTLAKYNKLNLDIRGRGGMTALHYAAQLGNEDIVLSLLTHGANRLIKNDKDHVPFDIAQMNSHHDLLDILQYDPKVVSISLAAKHGDWRIMQALMRQGVSINEVKEHYKQSASGHKILQHELYTPLISCVAYQQIDLLSKIIAHPDIQINKSNLLGQTPLFFAVITGKEDSVLKLLLAGADRYHRDHQGYLPMDYAKKYQLVNIQKLLYYDPNRIYIHELISQNDFHGCVSLLKQGVDVNIPRLAFSPSEVTSLTSLARNPFDPPSLSPMDSISVTTFVQGETPLMTAAKCDRAEILALLLKAPNIRVEAKDSNQCNAIYYAVRQGHENMVLMLLKAGASRHFKDPFGMDLITLARNHFHEPVVALLECDPYIVHIHDMCYLGKILHTQALIKQGCPVNYRDERPGKHRQTPLQAACSAGKVQIVKYLLTFSEVIEHIDERDDEGRTSLMLAAGQGALDITSLLLKIGKSDRSLRDNQGLSARDYAAKHSFSCMFSFMSQTMMN